MATPKKEDPKGGEAKAKGGGAGKIVLLVVLVVVLVLGAVGATLYFTGALGKLLGHGGGGEDHGGGLAPAAAPRPSGPAQYLAIDPPFVVSIDDQGQLRYVQISVSAMARDKKILEAVTQNAPQIRNNLIMLFGRQSFQALTSPEGREKLRADTLDTIQKVLTKEIGQPGVEEIYFTNFVMQ